MIQSLSVTSPRATPIRWWPDVFPRSRTFKFKEGINVLWGPNGSGKSTILRMIGLITHSLQSGVSVITRQSLDDLFGSSFGRPDEFKVSLTHDGQKVVHYDPNRKVGLMGGAFDDEFFSDGVREATSRGSMGEHALRRLVELGLRAKGEKIEDAMTEKYGRSLNDFWKRRIALATSLLEPSIEKGPRTLLLDEPDANLDWVNRLAFWEDVKRSVEEQKLQIIVASHSPFALKLDSAHWIELKRGYRRECIRIAKEAGLWSGK